MKQTILCILSIVVIAGAVFVFKSNKGGSNDVVKDLTGHWTVAARPNETLDINDKGIYLFAGVDKQGNG